MQQTSTSAFSLYLLVSASCCLRHTDSLLSGSASRQPAPAVYPQPPAAPQTAAINRSIPLFSFYTLSFFLPLICHCPLSSHHSSSNDSPYSFRWDYFWRSASRLRFMAEISASMDARIISGSIPIPKYCLPSAP